MDKPKCNTLFESSWEVCNKVGGIYTVIKSKAALMKSNYKNYYLIGPYFENQVKFEFQAKEPNEILKEIFERLKKEGIICYFGTWNITGDQATILIDSSGYINKKDELKKFYWDNYKIDSISSQWDFEEPLIWSTCVGKLMEEYTKESKETVVLHSHEWLAGFSILYLKNKKSKIATVFTTHATMLGRVLCAQGFDLYNNLDKINPLETAKSSGIIDKFTTELACAKECDVFTTVSEITAMEAEKLLGRKADVILLNGLDAEKFPSFEELSIKHQTNKRIIKEFIAYYFYPYYYFDLDETYIYFIVGRYEFKNKGLDIFIKALAGLNEKLKKENINKTIVVFFWIPTHVISAKPSLAQNKLSFHRMKHFIEDQSDKLRYKIMSNIMECQNMTCFQEDIPNKTLLDEEFIRELTKLRVNFQRQGLPPLITHNIPNEDTDIIIKTLLENNLNNSSETKVKVIFYPVYLTGIDGLTDLPYYEAITGCHLGIFPSYYEPWGYTPLETAALGVPSLTTDLGGFGRFLLTKTKGEEGIYVLKRFKKSEEDIIKDFTNILQKYAKFSRNQRVKEKITAKKLSGLADWNTFIQYYIEAHNKGVNKVWGN